MSPQSATAAGLHALHPPRDPPGSFPEDPSLPYQAPPATSTQHSLTQAVRARRAEYTRSKTIRIKIGSWNVAALQGTEKDVGGWFVEGKGIAEALAGLEVKSTAPLNSDPDHDGRESVADQEARATKKESTLPIGDHAAVHSGTEIGIYALGLQEVVDVGWTTESLRPYMDPNAAQKWKRALFEALPVGYQLVAEKQLSGILLLIYASPRLAPTITSVSTASIGTGLLGVMGNKGGVAARLLLGESTRLVFINAHLAAGADKASVDRRNWDASQIVNHIKFVPVDDGTGIIEETPDGIGDEDFAWWFGDLNYRLDGIPGADVRRLLHLHTQNEYDVSGNPETSQDLGEAASINSAGSGSSSSGVMVNGPTNPKTSCLDTTDEDVADAIYDLTSLQATLSSLLPHDQLRLQQAARKSFHDGWREGPIRFLPTYKYDVGSVGIFDSGDKRRDPGWCDRVLFRSRQDRLEYQKRLEEEAEAQKRDEELKARGVDKAAEEDDEVLFDYDPEADGADDDYVDDGSQNQPADVTTTRPGLEDRLRLETYTSHQRVISSDHKPLIAVFSLAYDAIDPELRAKVHQDVARELDKAENESRPGVTVVVDNHDSTHRESKLPARPSSESTSSDNVDYGGVSYAEERVRGITIANTGRVPATIHFVKQPTQDGQEAIAKPWLDVRYDQLTSDGMLASTLHAEEEYEILPGDSINIALTLLVTDYNLVRRLNRQEELLETVLILRVTSGRDHFIPVRATWLPSSFGRTIDELVKIQDGGVRGTPKSLAVTPTQVSHSAPLQVVRLTEAIEELTERVIAEWSMTSKENTPPWANFVGWPFAENSQCHIDSRLRATHRLYIHEALDTDKPPASLLPDSIPSLERLELISSTLIDLLQSLPDGVITADLWATLEDAILARERTKTVLSVDEERTWILDSISSQPNHNITFVFLTSMLARVTAEVAPLRASQETAPSGGRLSVETGRSATTPTRKRRSETLSPDPIVARRQLVDQGLAKIFARAMIRGELSTREKERKVAEDRRRGVVEVFLRGRWEDAR